MPWLLASPGHQQPWYWLCRIGRSLSYSRRNFNYLCVISVEEWHKIWIYVYVPSEKFSTSRDNNSDVTLFSPLPRLLTKLPPVPPRPNEPLLVPIAESLRLPPRRLRPDPVRFLCHWNLLLLHLSNLCHSVLSSLLCRRPTRQQQRSTLSRSSPRIPWTQQRTLQRSFIKISCKPHYDNNKEGRWVQMSIVMAATNLGEPVEIAAWRRRRRDWHRGPLVAVRCVAIWLSSVTRTHTTTWRNIPPWLPVRCPLHRRRGRQHRVSCLKAIHQNIMVNNLILCLLDDFLTRLYLIDNWSALVQVMAWRLTGDKPLPESMLIEIFMWHHQATMYHSKVLKSLKSYWIWKMVIQAWKSPQIF